MLTLRRYLARFVQPGCTIELLHVPSPPSTMQETDDTISTLPSIPVGLTMSEQGSPHGSVTALTANVLLLLRGSTIRRSDTAADLHRLQMSMVFRTDSIVPGKRLLQDLGMQPMPVTHAEL